jgi:hypothetical protein
MCYARVWVESISRVEHIDVSATPKVDDVVVTAAPATPSDATVTRQAKISVISGLNTFAAIWVPPHLKSAFSLVAKHKVCPILFSDH